MIRSWNTCIVGRPRRDRQKSSVHLFLTLFLTRCSCEDARCMVGSSGLGACAQPRPTTDGHLGILTSGRLGLHNLSRNRAILAGGTLSQYAAMQT